MKLLTTGAATLGIELNEDQVGQFQRYHDELVDWNSRVNLTGVRGRDEVQSRLFLGSLAVSLALPDELLSRGGTVLDVGSGAGLPGIPLKIAFPRLRVTLMDATAKKTAFLAHVVRSLALGEVEVRTGRAEDMARDATLRESFDAVLARALAKLPILAELCLPFCRTGGLVVAHKAAGVDEEVRLAETAIETMGGRLMDIKEITVGGTAPHGVLVVLEKAGDTPDRYPRRPGIPAKRPL